MTPLELYQLYPSPAPPSDKKKKESASGMDRSMYGRVLGPAEWVLLHKMNITPVPINIITGRRSSRGEVFVTPVFSRAGDLSSSRGGGSIRS